MSTIHGATLQMSKATLERYSSEIPVKIHHGHLEHFDPTKNKYNNKYF